MNIFEKFLPVFAPEGSAGSPTPSAAPATPAPSGGESSGASSSGSSSTSESPASPPSSGAVETPSGEDPFDFASFLDGTSEGVIEPPLSAPPPPKPSSEVTPPSVGEGGAQAQKPDATAGETPKPAQAGPQEGAGTAPSPPLTPAEPLKIAEGLLQHEAALTQHVAKELFKLSPEEVEALEANAVEAIPNLLAKGYVKSQYNLMRQLAQVVPAMIQKQTAVMQRVQDSQSRFYDRWKDAGIDRVKHGDLVTKYAMVYRQANPQATREQMIEDLGPMVIMAAKIAPPTPAPAGRGNGQRAPAGAARPPQPPPFVPAVGGAAAGSATTELDEPWMIADPTRD